MFVRLAMLFILVPLVELYVLIQLGSHVGVEITIGIVVITGLIGAWLARMQGIKVLREVRASLALGEMPADAIVDGLLILLAGAVLLTPGVLTDALGFALLVPAGRRLARGLIRKRLPARVTGFDPNVIDVEWRSDNG
jgi:UPF0716 protein FxsA